MNESVKNFFELPGDTLVSCKELCRSLHCDRQQFNRWCRVGKGPQRTQLAPRLIMYRVDHVKEWIMDNLLYDAIAMYFSRGGRP
jgi:hypothetical protein